MADDRDEPNLNDEDARALDTELHGGLADDATDAEVDAAGSQEATSADDVDKERSGPS